MRLLSFFRIPQSLLASPLLAALLVGPLSSPASANVLITIDKSAQRMTVWVDGTKEYTWPVSTGRPGFDTPSGTYSALSMNEEWYSKQWDNSPMPHSIFFMKDGHAIHGSYEVKNLGKAASYGCVRVSPENAATLYALVEKEGMANTQVVVSGGGQEVAQPKKQRQPQYGQAGPGDGYTDRSYPSYSYVGDEAPGGGTTRLPPGSEPRRAVGSKVRVIEGAPARAAPPWI
ncbi:MAG: L,D-transpeptidase [Methyloceanibacter sp.]